MLIYHVENIKVNSRNCYYKCVLYTIKSITSKVAIILLLIEYNEQYNYGCLCVLKINSGTT